MFTTIFNPRLPILADELAVQGQFAKGDKEEEWVAESKSHFQLEGCPVTVMPGDEAEFKTPAVWEAHKHCVYAATTGQWKIRKPFVIKTAKGSVQ
jgi:hypothetical protein